MGGTAVGWNALTENATVPSRPCTAISRRVAKPPIEINTISALPSLSRSITIGWPMVVTSPPPGLNANFSKGSVAGSGAAAT